MVPSSSGKDSRFSPGRREFESLWDYDGTIRKETLSLFIERNLAEAWVHAHMYDTSLFISPIRVVTAALVTISESFSRRIDVKNACESKSVMILDVITRMTYVILCRTFMLV